MHLNSSILLDSMKGNLECICLIYSLFLATLRPIMAQERFLNCLELPHRLPQNLHHRFHHHCLLTTEK